MTKQNKQKTGALYLDPIIHQHEDSTERVSDYLLAEAARLGRPVFTEWLGVPILGEPYGHAAAMVAAWQVDYARLLQAQQAEETETEEEQEQYEADTNDYGYEPKVPKRRLLSTLPFLGAVLIGIGLGGWLHDLQARTLVVSYDKRDASVTINFDAWRKAIECPANDVVQMDTKAVGSAHGNVSYKLTPYCSAPVVTPQPTAVMPQTAEGQ